MRLNASRPSLQRAFYRDMTMKPIFRGFCINRFGIGPLHYISSRSDFGFEFAEIIAIEKRLADRRVGESLSRYWMLKRKLRSSVSRRVVDSPNRWVGESVTPWLGESGITNSPTRRVGESFFDYEYLREYEAKGSVRDLWGSNLCKTPRKSSSLPCTFILNRKIFKQII